MSEGVSEPGALQERHNIAASREEIDRVQKRIFEVLDQCGYDPAAHFAIRTAIEEAVSNALHHGNDNDSAKRLIIEYVADPTSVTIVIEDEGAGFDPGSVPDPTRPENVDIPSGRGIMLMRAYMSEVEFRPPGNRVRMTYIRPS